MMSMMRRPFLLPLVLLLQLLQRSHAQPSLRSCVFYYEEGEDPSVIPSMPRHLLQSDADPEEDLPSCPPGAYDKETWSKFTMGCLMQCIPVDMRNRCISAGYKTHNSSVFFMGCRSQSGSYNPLGVPVLNCGSFPNGGNSIMCDTCGEDYCIPPLFGGKRNGKVEPTSAALAASSSSGQRPPEGGAASPSSSSGAAQSKWESENSEDGFTAGMGVVVGIAGAFIVMTFVCAANRGYYVLHNAPPLENAKHTPDPSGFFGESHASGLRISTEELSEEGCVGETFRIINEQRDDASQFQDGDSQYPDVGSVMPPSLRAEELDDEALAEQNGLSELQEMEQRVHGKCGENIPRGPCTQTVPSDEKAGFRLTRSQSVGAAHSVGPSLLSPFKGILSRPRAMSGRANTVGHTPDDLPRPGAMRIRRHTVSGPCTDVQALENRVRASAKDKTAPEGPCTNVLPSGLATMTTIDPHSSVVASRASNKSLCGSANTEQYEKPLVLEANVQVVDNSIKAEGQLAHPPLQDKNGTTHPTISHSNKDSYHPHHDEHSTRSMMSIPEEDS